MTQSVHDHFIVSYEVHCKRREIRLQTEAPTSGEPFTITVVFLGVEAYDFRHDCLGNIIFGIEEVSVEKLLTENLAQFEEGSRLAGWPWFWKSSLDEVRDYLQKRGIRGFELSSSYGMSGWVLARDVQMLR